MKFKACLVRFLAAAVYHSRPTTANPGGWIQETLPLHPILNKPLYTDAEMIPKLVKLLGNVHGNHFVRQGVDPRDKASFLMSPCHAFSCTAMMSSMYHTTFFARLTLMNLKTFFLSRSIPIMYFIHTCIKIDIGRH